MKNIQLLNKIAKVGTDRLDPAVYQIGAEVEAPVGIMVRSAKMHDMTFNKELLAIARAGAGVNNIPVDRCAEEGIVVFNTPGANANGVKELAICALLLASRRIIEGVGFAKGLAGSEDVAKQVEAGKSQFGGCEIMGKTLGVIGLGAIGGMVANAALALGMKVVGCDPFLSAAAAAQLDSRVARVDSFDEVFEKADYVTLHVPATNDTKGMICARTLALMKDGVRIINLARAELVNAADMAEALASGKAAAYVTDFPTEETVAMDGVITSPHLGASTEESEDNCAVMAAEELDAYLALGTIRNSVNYPNLNAPVTGAARVCVLHDAAAAEAVTAVLDAAEVDVASVTTAAKGANGYTVADLATVPTADLVGALTAIEGIRRARVIVF